MKKRLLSFVLTFILLVGGLMISGEVALAQDSNRLVMPPTCVLVCEVSVVAVCVIAEPEWVLPNCVPGVVALAIVPPQWIRPK